MIRNFIQIDSQKVPSLAFHTMTLCEENIVIYGGMNGVERIFGDLIFLKFHKDKFLVASYENNKHCFPKPRHSHSASYDSKNKKLYIFGGMVGDNVFTDEFWCLDVGVKPTFTQMKPVSVSPRCRHVSFIHNRKLYIYGGYGYNSITKNTEILHDLCYYHLDKGNDMKEVVTKGGIEMTNFLFKAIKLHNEEDKFAFFCADLTMFFILDLETETFTKVLLKFSVPQFRENFTVDIISDGRIILFGGMNEDECYNEAYSLIKFTYYHKDLIKTHKSNKLKIEDEEKFHYHWHAIDIYGPLEDYKGINNGYNGHAMICLPNDHLLIHGGTQDAFFPYFTYSPNLNGVVPKFTKRLKLLDIFNTYKWESPISNIKYYGFRI